MKNGPANKVEFLGLVHAFETSVIWQCSNILQHICSKRMLRYLGRERSCNFIGPYQILVIKAQEIRLGSLDHFFLSEGRILA